MDQLRFTGLHEDGAHLVVTAADGSDFTVPVDDRLRAALRPSAAEVAGRTHAATPREVQTQIRSGMTAQEVCDVTGWTVERVQRYEGPILAEREHITGLARQAFVRTHDRSAPAPTLESRVHDRLQVRGVDLDQVSWDSMRPDGGQWSVHVRFMAGQRIRQAGWTFDPSARSVDAIDDEARWLSEDEQTLPAGAPSTALFGAGMDGPDDLMATMRERSRRRGQGQGRQRKETPDTEFGSPDSQALPLEDLPHDPDTMGLPPAAGPDGDAEHDDPNAGEADRSGGNTDSVDDNSPEHNSPKDTVSEGGEEDLDDGAVDSDEREATLTDFFGDDDARREDAEGGDPLPSAQEGETTSSRGRKGRPSVPSWDDIMFGARDKNR